jgi:hypothetical protein
MTLGERIDLAREALAQGHPLYLPCPRKFFRRAISTSFLPMSCSRSRIFFSSSFSWVSLEKTVAPFASYALRA